MEFKEIILWLFLFVSVTINIIYLYRTYKENYKKTFEDPLTKLRNRKFLDEIKQMVSLGHDKYDVIFCDIDHFKRVNDTYGHDVGDIVLKIVGQKLNSNFKLSKDYVVRYGGEEFIIFLRQDSTIDTKNSIYKRINELRENIEKDVVNAKGTDIKFTMSFGICYFDENIPFDDQIKKADEALYYSKNNGRNRVTIFSDITPES